MQLLQEYILKVVSSEFYFHKPITVHIELYLFYRFIHFLLYMVSIDCGKLDES